MLQHTDSRSAFLCTLWLSHKNTSEGVRSVTTYVDPLLQRLPTRVWPYQNGNVNHLKFLKRQMSGRAHLDLPRVKVLRTV